MKKRRGGCSRIFAWLIIIAALAVAVWRGNTSIKTEEVELSISSLSAEFGDFRIAQVSDLHGKTFGKDGFGLAEAVAEAKPDIIAITGDIADSSSGLDGIKEQVESLVKIAPVYYVTGNHEWAASFVSELDDIMSSCGATVLHNSYCEITKGDSTLIIAGVDDPNGPADAPGPHDLVARIRQEYESAPIVLLAHRNEPHRYEGLDIGLILCGHGHGGVIRVPGIGGLIGVDRSFLPEYDAGWFALEKGGMYVSRGLGGNDFEVRVFNRPHLPVLVLKGEQ